LDLLSLKKLVIEDLKNEIQIIRPGEQRMGHNRGGDYPEVNIRGGGISNTKVLESNDRIQETLKKVKDEVD